MPDLLAVTGPIFLLIARGCAAVRAGFHRASFGSLAPVRWGLHAWWNMALPLRG